MCNFCSLLTTYLQLPLPHKTIHFLFKNYAGANVFVGLAILINEFNSKKRAKLVSHYHQKTVIQHYLDNLGAWRAESIFYPNLGALP